MDSALMELVFTYQLKESQREGGMVKRDWAMDSEKKKVQMQFLIPQFTKSNIEENWVTAFILSFLIN